MAVRESAPRPEDGAAVASPENAEPNSHGLRGALWGPTAIPYWIGATRIALGVIFAHLIVVLAPGSRQHLPGGALSNSSWLGAFDRWDSAYYLGIAQHGYPINSPAHLAAFFPGYPVLVAIVHGASFGTVSFLDAALVVSWVAFIGASVLLYRLATRLFGQRVGLVATLLFCWFPTSLFFLSPYSEALFAFEILAVATLIERKRFLAAALVAAFASATSPESVALSLAVVVAALLARRGVVRSLLCGAISAAGLIAYSSFLWVQFGHPLEFITVQKYWMRSEHWPFVGLYRNVLALLHFRASVAPSIPSNTNIHAVWILDDAALVVAVALLVALVTMWAAPWRVPHPGEERLTDGSGRERGAVPVTFVVVMLVIVGLAACTTISPYALPTYASSEGQARFISVVFPLYISAALLVRRYAALICVAVGGSVILALLFQAMYNLGYWVT